MKLWENGAVRTQDITQQLAINKHFFQQYVSVAGKKGKTNILTFDNIKKLKQIIDSPHKILAAFSTKKLLLKSVGLLDYIMYLNKVQVRLCKS